MKTLNNILFVYMATILLTFASCSKDGSMGPQGPEGPQGEQGSIGIPGKDGAVILSGSDAPTASLGNTGDMYLDINSSNLYGPKADTGWGTPLTLKGEDGDKGDKGDKGDTGDPGAAGADGTRIFSGANNPLSTLGRVGDFYLNETTGDLFGPKPALFTWGNPISLKGTANVVSSTWFQAKPWSTGSGSRPAHIAHYTVPPAILNAVGSTSFAEFQNSGGVFILYLGIGGSVSDPPTRYQLPITLTTNAMYGYVLRNTGNEFEFFVQHLDGTSFTQDHSNYRLRYVLIPAGLQINGVANINGQHIPIDQLKTMIYGEMKELLDLED